MDVLEPPGHYSRLGSGYGSCFAVQKAEHRLVLSLTANQIQEIELELEYTWTIPFKALGILTPVTLCGTTHWPLLFPQSHAIPLDLTCRPYLTTLESTASLGT
jgi:hypothetical protein